MNPDSIQTSATDNRYLIEWVSDQTSSVSPDTYLLNVGSDLSSLTIDNLSTEERYILHNRILNMFKGSTGYLF